MISLILDQLRIVVKIPQEAYWSEGFGKFKQDSSSD